MVPLEGIQKAHPMMTYSDIHQLIYLRHRERILGASFVQICEIYTYSPFFTFLLYYHRVGQPVRVKHLLHSPSLLKFDHLILDNIRMLFR